MGKREADELRKFFVDGLKELGLTLVQFSPPAQLYSVEAGFDGTVYLKVCSDEAGFWGLRKEYLDCFLGEIKTTKSEREFVRAALERDGSGFESSAAPKKQFPAIIRRLLLELEKKPWIVILLKPQPRGIDVEGYVLAPDNVRSAVDKKLWSLSDKSHDGGEWKVCTEMVIT